MRQPSAVGSPVDIKRFKKWVSEFGSFRSSVTQQTLELWLNQFKKKDRDLAARILDSVLFIGHSQASTKFREILNGLDGWNSNPSKRKGRWFFVAMSGSSGESGDAVLYQFRHANNLAHKTHNHLFIHRSEIVAQKLTEDDTIILVDDFAGSGEQVCSYWDQTYSELVIGAGRIYLVLLAATQGAAKEIQKKTDLMLFPSVVLRERDSFFSDKCTAFSEKDKATALVYNKMADPRQPRGYGDCGVLVVFAHQCPNNSLPILHASNSKWDGLFARAN